MSIFKSSSITLVIFNDKLIKTNILYEKKIKKENINHYYV